MKKYNLFRSIVIFIQEHKKSKSLRGALISLASLTVFTTTYALILPALTLEKNEAAQMPGVDLEEDALYEDGIVEYDDFSEGFYDPAADMDDWYNGQEPSGDEGFSDEYSDYLVDDENGISDEEWEELLSEGDFFVDEDIVDFSDEEEPADSFDEEDEENVVDFFDEVDPVGFSNEEGPEEAAILDGTEDVENAENAEGTENTKSSEAVIDEAELVNKSTDDAEEETNADELPEETAFADESVEKSEEALERALGEDAETDSEKREEPVNDTASSMIKTVTENLTEEVTEAVTEEITEEATEAVTEENTEEATEAVTEETTEEATEAVTEEITEEATEAVTEETTEAETEAVSEEPTEEVTEAVTEAATEEIAEEVTEAVTEGVFEAVTEEAIEWTTEAITEDAESIVEESTEAEAAEEFAEEITEASTEEEYVELNYPAQHFEVYTKYMYIEVAAPEGAFPEDTTITIEDIEDEETIETISSAVDGNITRVHAVDITFWDTRQNEIEPLLPIQVTMTELDAVESVSEKEEIEGADEISQAEETPVIVHLQNDGETQLMETIDGTAAQAAEQEVAFEASSFSIYALVYTVDFHYEINGKMFEFSIPGGGFVSLEHVVEVLGIAAADENSDNGDENAGNRIENGDDFVEEAPGKDESGKNGKAYEETIRLNEVVVSESTKKFVSDVESVEFSSPELMWVGKVDSTTAVGGLKEANGLKVEYSAELTEEQITEINAQTVEAGDWALISLQPFTTTETLTVTLDDGQVFTIEVTDEMVTNIDNGGRYIIVVPGENGYYVLKGDGSTVLLNLNGGSLEDALDILPDDYLWTFSNPEYQGGKTWWRVRSDESYYVSLDNDHRRAGTIVDYTPSGIAFDSVGYYDLLNAHRDIWNGQWGWNFGFDRYYIGLNNSGKIAVLNETEANNYYSALWLYKQEGRTYNFTVKTEYNNVHRGTVSGRDKDNIQRNNLASFVGVTNTGKYNFTNSNEISATAATGYKFECWKLGDRVLTDADFLEPPVLSNNGKTSTIKPGKLALPEDNLVLTAVFSKNPDEYGGVADYSALIHEYMQSLKKDPLITNKTAEVYDYDNRIYEVDFEYTGDAQIITPDVELAFVTDVSRSMFFPSKLKSVNTFSSGNSSDLISKLDALHNARKAETDSSDHDEVYYLVANPGTDATVYAVRKDGNTWKIIDASYDVRTHGKSGVGIKNGDPWYYYAESDLGKSDGHGGTYNNYNNFPYNRWYDLSDFVSSNGNLYHNSLKKTFSDLNIYIAEDHIYRLDYLQQAVDIAANTVYSQNKNATTGLVTFAKTAQATSLYSRAQYNQLIYDLNNITPTGNTNQRAGLETAASTYWQNNGNATTDPNHKRVVILVTDGAPNPGSGQPNSDWGTINASNGIATQLKNTYGATLYTIGISVDQVDGAKQGLYNAASPVSDADGTIGTNLNNQGYKYAFFTSDGPGLVESILQIVQSLYTQVDLYGTMSDTVDAAFYPVNADGTPVRQGYYRADGTPITDTSELTPLNDNHTEYYQWVCEGETWKITWFNIKFKRGTKDSNGNVLVPGDRKTILIKSKEDFLGGNTINTNQGEAWAVANYYMEIVKPNQTVNIKGVLAPPVNREMPSPWVNVDELAMDQNDTEWTVYLGTNVDPKVEIQKLLEKINIREVVTRSESQAHQQGLYWADSQVMSYDPNNPSGSGTTIYNIDASSDAWQDNDQTLKNVTPASFTLDNAIRSIQRTTSGQPTLTNAQWATLCSDGELTFKYYGDPAYGHGSETAPVGVITLKVEKTIAAGEGSIPDAHDTTVTNAGNGGQPVEKYTLTATYTPGTGQTVDDWHTGNHKTGHAGVVTDSMTSVNHHNINVFSKPLDILKVDKDNTAITEKTAAFELLRSWAAGDTDETKKVIFGTTQGYTGYKLDGADLTGAYYLVDTQVTDTNTGIAHFGTGTDAAKLLSSAKDPYIIIEKTAPSGYAKDVNAKTITIVTDGDNMNLYSDLNKAAIINTSYPSTGNPYNWNQAVQFQVTEYNATSNQNQTSVINYVNKDTGAEITLNEPGYTVGEPWKATGDARNPIYVFSNIENTKELIQDDVNGVGAFRFSVINEPQVIDINLKKTDGKNEILGGAIFELEVKNSSDVYQPVTSADVADYNDIKYNTGKLNGDGERVESVALEEKRVGAKAEQENSGTLYKATFTTPDYTEEEIAAGAMMTLESLPNGEYKLIEVYAPAGYVIMLSNIEFKIEEGVMEMVTTDDTLHFTGASNGETPTLALLEIENIPGAALPNTGGPGTDLFYLLGIMLTGISGTGMVMKRRKRTA